MNVSKFEWFLLYTLFHLNFISNTKNKTWIKVLNMLGKKECFLFLLIIYYLWWKQNYQQACWKKKFYFYLLFIIKAKLPAGLLERKNIILIYFLWLKQNFQQAIGNKECYFYLLFIIKAKSIYFIYILKRLSKLSILFCFTFFFLITKRKN